MEDSAGSADAEMSKVEETITYKINALKETWTGFLQELVNRDAVKGVIDFATELSSAFTSLGVGGQAGIFAAVVAGILKLKSTTDETGQSMLSFGKIVRSALGTDVLRSQYLDSYAENLSTLSVSAAEASIQATKLTKAEKEALITKAGLAVATKTQLSDQEKQIAEYLASTLVIKGQIASTDELTGKELLNAVSTGALTKEQAALVAQNYLCVSSEAAHTSALTALSGALGLTKLQTIALLTTMAAAAAAVAVIIVAWQKQEQAVKDLNEGVSSAFDSYNEAKSTAKNTASTISGLTEEYERLSKGVDAFGNNISLSSDDFERYNEISNQIADLMPDMVDHWTDENNAVLKCKDSVEELTAAYGDLEVQAARELIAGTDENSGADAIIQDFQNTINGVDEFWVQKTGLKDQVAEIENANTYITKLKDLTEKFNAVEEDTNETLTETVELKDALQDFEMPDSDNINELGSSLSNYISDLQKTETELGTNGAEIFAQTTELQREKTKESNEELEKSNEKLEKYRELYRDYIEEIQILQEKLNTVGDDFDIEVPNFYNDIATGGSLSDYADDFDALEKSLNSKISELNSQMDEAREKVKALANAYLQIDTNELSDDQKSAISSYISSLSDDVIDGLDSKTAVSKLVGDICAAMANDTEVSNAIIGLFSIDKNMTIEAAQAAAEVYIDALKKALEDGRIDEDIYNRLMGGLDDWYNEEQSLNHNASQQSFNVSLNSNGQMQRELAQVDAYTKKFTVEQSQAWREYLNSCNQTFTTAADMIAAYEQSLVEAAESSGFDTKTFSETMSSFDDIVEAYDKVKENIQDGKTGEAIASDIEDVEGLRDQFEALGDAADYGDWEDFDDLEETLTSGTATAAEVQAAWNQLATTFADAKISANGYTEATKELISTQLQEAGVTKESADEFAESKVAMAEANDLVSNSSTKLSDMSAEEVQAFADEVTQSESTKQAIYLLYLEKIACGEATITTSGDIENLYNLALQAGATTTQLEKLAQAKALVGTGGKVDQLKDELATAKNKYGKGTTAYTQAETRINAQIKAAETAAEKISQEATQEIADYVKENSGKLNVNGSNSNSSSSGSGSGSGSSSDKDSDKDEDKWLKAYEKAYERLGELRDRDKIDEYEYLQYSRALYEKYFDSLNTSNTEWNNYVKLKKQYESLVEQKEKLAKQNAEASKTSASPEIKEEKENLEKLNAEYAELQKQLEEAKEARKAAYSDDWMGNVNLNDRPTVGGQTMAAAGWDEAGGVDSYSTVFTNTTTVKNPTNGSPWVVQFTPILPDGTVMDEQSCFDYIDSIISDATSAEEVMARDKADKGILFGVFDSYANDQGEVVSIDWDSNLDEAEEYYQEIAELRHEDQADIYDAEGAIVQEQQDVSNQIVAATQNIKDAVGDSAEDTQEAADKTGETVDSLEEKIKAASEKLSEAEKNLSDDTREYLEQLEEAEYNYLNGMKSLYESVFTWISSQLDDQTSELEDAKSKASDALEKQKTAATNALKAEKEAAVANIEAQIDALKDQQDAIQDQIDAYQDEIDAINDANDAREREITLQKALYELDKLNSQRTNLVYSESQGMHYEADLSGIRDAREDVDDAKDDIEIAKLEKKIDLLEDEKDALDDLIDDLEDQKDAIEDYYDKLIDESEAYYDNLIEESEAYYDNLIEQLEKQKDAVDELQDRWERAKMVASIRDLTGIDTSQLWDGLKNGSAEAIAQLSSLIDQLGSGYDNIVETMEKDNTHVLSTFESLNGIDLSSTTNYLDETADAFDKLAAVDFDVVKTGVDGIRDAFKSFSKDSDVVDVLGEHLGEAIAKGISDAKDSSEVKDAADSAGTETSKKVGESMTSEEAKSSIKEGAKEAVTEAGNSVKESAENGDAKEATDAAGTAIVKTVSDGMTSESATATLDEKSLEVITAAATSVTNAANGEQNADMLTAGEAIVCAIVNAMNSALDGAAGLVGLNTFVTKFATKLQEQFSALDLSKTLDFASLFGLSEEDGEDGSNSLSAFIQQFVDAITKLNEQVKLVDISPIVTQFEDLKDAITGAAEALGGGEGGMSESTGEGGEGGNASGGKSKSSSSSNSGSEGSLISAMETLGTTAEDVLGGGEEGEGDGEEGGAGIIGKFATLKTKVQDVTAAIGLGDEEEGGGSSTEEEGGTLISAFEAEKKTFFDEEQGLPKQLEVWEEIMTAINGCVTAIEMLKKALIDLAEFSISVSVGGETSGFGGSKADGTFSFADGNLHVASHGYAGGNVGLAQDQQAYVGESGTELLVRSGQARLIGKNGAEMMSLKKGDIIFNASQTKELLKNGKIHSRGHAVGTHSYADGTPFNKALNFAGKDFSSSALTAIANQLTGAMLPMESNIEAINRNVADMAASVSNISSVNNTSNVTIGDIHVTGVQDVDGFAKAIKSYLPGKMTQALYS